MKITKSKNISSSRLGKLLSNVRNQVDFLQMVKIFPTSVCCDCENVIREYKIWRDRILFRCSKCQKKDFNEVSIRNLSYYHSSRIIYTFLRRNTILENSKISNRRFVLLAYSITKSNWTYTVSKNSFFILHKYLF